MQNNVNFRKDLIVAHLYNLISYGYNEEFTKLYSSIEGYLAEVVAKSQDTELLEKVRSIITFREKNVGMAM